MIPHFDLGGTGAPLHFLHANGYPPDCYKPLFELLKTEYRVFGMTLRPLWPDAKMADLEDWLPLSDDLQRFLADASTTGLLGSYTTVRDANMTGDMPFSLCSGLPDPPLSANEKVIGVGHSIGGIVTLRTALREPKFFRALILLEPVLFPPYLIVMSNIARSLGLGYRVYPNILGVLKRRREFSNLDMIFRSYRNRDVFRYLSDENLQAYIAGITKPKAGGGYELVYTPEWESHIYYTGIWRDMDIWRNLKNLQVPTLIIRGAETDTFWKSAARLVKRKQPKIHIEEISQSTHLVPLERPKEVFDIMQSFLKETLESDG